MKVRSRSGDLHGLRVSRHPSHPSQQHHTTRVLEPTAAREQVPVAIIQQPTATNFFGHQRILTANTNEEPCSTIYYMPTRKMTAPAKARLNERSSSFLWKTERSSTVVSLSNLLQEKVKVLDRVYEKEMGGLTGNGDLEDTLVQPRKALNLSLLKGQNGRSLTARKEASKKNGNGCGGQTERSTRKVHIQLVRLCTPHYIEVVGGETRYYRFQAPQNKAVVVMLSFMSVEGMFELYVSEVLQYPSRLECTFNTSISGGNKDIPFSVNTEGKWISLAVFATKTAKFHLIVRIEAVEDNFTVSGGVGGAAATEGDEHLPLNPGGETGRDLDKIGSFAVDKVKLMSALQQKIKMIKMKRRINIVNDAIKRNIEITEKYPEIKSNYFISLVVACVLSSTFCPDSCQNLLERKE